MPFDNSGNFNRARGPGTWQSDATAGVKIKADLHDANDNDIADALSLAICKDGQSSPTADISLNNHKLTNVTDPVNPQDAVTKRWAEDTIRNFSMGMRLTGTTPGTGQPSAGISKAVLGFTEADMSIVARKADTTVTPNTVNRLVINDKADGTGTDIFSFLETGTSMRITVLTTSGTYTKPPGLTFLKVTIVGGGGGSPGVSTTGAGVSTASGGGAGGGTVMQLYAAASIAATVAYTVGQGGSGATTATAGTSTTWMGLTAGGGAAGAVQTGAGSTLGFTAGSAGGIATGGYLNIPGQPGGQGIRAAHGNAGIAMNGAGGGSFFAQARISIQSSVAAGTPGAFPGGGASGALAGASQTGVNGAPGGDGCIILEEYF